MTIQALSDTIARAVLDTVERDRCCNLENIRGTALKELAVSIVAAAIVPAAPDTDLRAAALDMQQEIVSHINLSAMPSCFVAAVQKLTKALDL